MKQCIWVGFIGFVLVATCSKETKKNSQPNRASVVDSSVTTERSRADILQAGLSRVEQIKKDVALLRGLSFREPVAAKHQTEADFRKFVKKAIAMELPPARNEALGKALVHIGLLPEPIDLAKKLEEALISQVGAYYDPQSKAFYLVMVSTSDLLLDAIISHEIDHALQDQHFNIYDYYQMDGNGQSKLTEDQLSARRFIVEGEATLIMMAHGVKAMVNKNVFESKLLLGQLRPQIEKMAQGGLKVLTDAAKAQAGAFLDLGEDVKKAIDAMDKIPVYILLPLLESYTKGALPVLEAFGHGGWSAVNALYKNPPDSTEQVLHPREKLFPKRDYPVTVALKGLMGWKEVHSDVIGELGWRVYFEVWDMAELGDPAAAGWDGDRYAVYEKDGQLAAVMATVWDSPAEAKQFADAFLTSLNKRFPQGQQRMQHDVYVKPRGNTNQVIVLQVKNAEVFIADGANESQALAHLANAQQRVLSEVKAR